MKWSNFLSTTKIDISDILLLATVCYTTSEMSKKRSKTSKKRTSKKFRKTYKNN